MKINLLAVLIFVSTASTMYAQDTCKVFGQKNPHGLAMEIKGPMTVADTLNFTVESKKSLPYNISATDTIFFNVCIKARDGKKHSTQVKYNSTHGAISYTVSLQAPSTAGVEPLQNTKGLTIFTYPNPAKDYVHVTIENSVNSVTQVQIYNDNGVSISSHTVPVDGNVIINTVGYNTGIYHAFLKSGNSLIGSKDFVVIK